MKIAPRVGRETFRMKIGCRRTALLGVVAPLAVAGWGLPLWTGFCFALVLLFGGRGKISGLMGDLAKGVTEFRKGLRDDGDKDDEKSSSNSASAALEEGGAQDGQSTREDERTGG